MKLFPGDVLTTVVVPEHGLPYTIRCTSWVKMLDCLLYDEPPMGGWIYDSPETCILLDEKGEIKRIQFGYGYGLINLPPIRMTAHEAYMASQRIFSYIAAIAPAVRYEDLDKHFSDLDLTWTRIRKLQGRVFGDLEGRSLAMPDPEFLGHYARNGSVANMYVMDRQVALVA